MSSFWKKLIIKTVLRQKKNSGEAERAYSEYEVAKGFRELRITLFSFLKNTLFITAGIGSAAFGLESFLLPNKFIDGGATGISLLVSELSAVPLYVLLVLVNIPFVYLGYKVIRKSVV